MTMYEIWAFEADVSPNMNPRDLVGYKVEAVDGSIGKIDSASDKTGSSSIVVDTGPWIFGKKVMLPAGVVQRVDADDERVYVNRTKDQIKGAPELDEARMDDPAYRDQLGGYYGQGGAGWADRSSH